MNHQRTVRYTLRCRQLGRMPQLTRSSNCILHYLTFLFLNFANYVNFLTSLTTLTSLTSLFITCKCTKYLMNYQLFLINFKSFLQKSLRKFARFKISLYLCRRFRENHLRRWAAPQHKTSFLHSVCTILAPLKKDRDLAQLVAHTSGGREVAGSSPVIPTEKEPN